MNPIMNFIEAKAKPDFLKDEDRLTDFPIKVSNPISNNIDTMYIQDVDRRSMKDSHLLEVTVLHITDDQFVRLFVISKRCVAPPDCHIDWDTVVCATSISWKSKIKDHG